MGCLVKTQVKVQYPKQVYGPCSVSTLVEISVWNFASSSHETFYFTAMVQVTIPDIHIQKYWNEGIPKVACI